MAVNFAKANPMLFGVGFSCCKTSVSDLVVQVFVERRENIDWKRNAAFASFGFGYLGIVQQFRPRGDCDGKTSRSADA